ncbi:MAG: hemolysin family protein [Gammaproteobacteria bacterium]|nr:hemolysin family protein [Gammaproteobacteria bacterium]MDE0259343.1 hemolysin family protein [Gammaproteobacteria bacterium]
MTTILLGLGLLLVVGSALLTAAQTACVTVGESRIRTLVDEGFQEADKLSRLREEPGRFLDSYVLFDTVFNAGAAALWVGASARVGAGSLVISAVVAVGMVLVSGELVPRAVAQARPVRLALLGAPALLLLERLSRPLLYPVRRFARYWIHRPGDEGRSAQEREVSELAELGQEEGVVMPEEHELAERAFRLDETTAGDVMTPRVSIFAWSDSLTLGDIIEQLPEVPYSRVPVYGDSIDDVTGILYVREAYAAHSGGQANERLSELSREPFFVPGSLPLTRLLRDFQSRRIHMGIVADEFGGTDGLVTLEDLLEELVGEIVDETDPASEAIVRVSRTEAIVEGSTELREINYAMNVSLPHLEHRSLNGFLVERLGHVPAPDEVVVVAGVDIRIVEASETQILRARLRKVPSPGGEGE